MDGADLVHWGTMLSLQHVTASRGSKVVLRDVSFDLEPGDVFCITGEEGSGKTSLLKVLTREIPTDEGAVSIDGAALSRLPREVLRLYRARLGILGEIDALDPTITLARNVALPLDLHGVDARERDRAVADLLKRLRVGTAADRLPGEVSRGERQLAAFARAIVTGPALLLLDEPFQGMGDETAGIAATMIENMCAKGATAIVASAEERTPSFFASPRLARMHRGRLTEASSPSLPAERVREVASVKMTELVERSEETAPEAPAIVHAPKEIPAKTGEKKKVRITSVGSL